MNEKLKPCLSCGTAGMLCETRGGYYVMCERPGYCWAIPRTRTYDTPEAAVAEWNTRPYEDALRRRLAKHERAWRALDTRLHAEMTFERLLLNEADPEERTYYAILTRTLRQMCTIAVRLGSVDGANQSRKDADQ